MINREFASYLSDAGFERLIEILVLKYQSHGRFAGKIVINDLSDNEKRCLSGLLGLDLSKGKLEITFLQLQKRIKQTRFEEVDLKKVIEILINQELISKKEIKEVYYNDFNDYKEELLFKAKDTKSYEWLKYYLDNDNFVRRYYDNDKDGYAIILDNVNKALNNLPIYNDNYELLAVFAQIITKNPHYFDEDIRKDLLLKGICYLLDIDIVINCSEDIFYILYQAGILKDDMSNYCYIAHLLPLDNNQAWLGFYNDYEPWNMNFYNIKNITSNFYSMPVIIVENPSVFIELCKFIKENKLDIGLVSSNGQINMCTYYLLDKLVCSNCNLYYAGDFDCEGLLIADKLKNKYPGINLLGYDIAYFNMIKTYQVEISNKRLQMLTGINDDSLKLIANAINSTLSFGYQEGLIEVYKELIKEL